MKKTVLFTLILLIIFVLCGCGNQDTFSKDRTVTIVVPPDEDTAYTINGYKDTTAEATSTVTNTDEEAYTGKYFGNINTKKYHRDYCRYAKSMDEKKLKLFDDTLDAHIEGYSPCSICNK